MFYNWCMSRLYCYWLFILPMFACILRLCVSCHMPAYNIATCQFQRHLLCADHFGMEKVSVAILKFRKVFNLNSTVQAAMLFTTILSTYYPIILSDILFRLVERKDSKVFIYWQIFIIATQYVDKIILGYK